MVRFSGVVLLIAVAGCAQSVDSQLTPADLVLEGGYVVDPADEGEPPRADIAIRDGRIVAIGEDLAERFAASSLVDATGKYVIPGLADMHSHFGNGILEGDADDTTQVLARHLYFGNTTILNLGSSQAWPERIDALREALASGELDGPRLLASGALITRVGSHPTTTIYAPELQAAIAEVVANSDVPGPIDLTPLRATTLVRTSADIREEVERLSQWGADAIKITVESGPSGFGDDHPRISADMIAAAVETAEPFGIPVLCHVSSADELLDCLDNGATGIAHAHFPDSVDDDALEAQMANADLAMIPTAGMFEGWVRYTRDLSLLDRPELEGLLSEPERAMLTSPGLVAAFSQNRPQELDWLRGHLAAYHDAGGLLVAGTDTGNPYRIAGLALHEELAFYVSAGLTPREALATATVNAARLMQAEDDWGAIREGLAADLVVLDANPLDDIANTLAISDVIRNGVVVNRDSLPLK